MVKNLPTMFDPWVGKIPWRRKWQPTSVFLPGKSHGRRSLVGYSPWGHKESDTTEQLHFHFLFYSQLFVRPPQTLLCLFAFLLLGDGLDSCLLYYVTNLHPLFIRHSVYQIQALKSISHFHCIIIRDLIQVLPEWSSGFPYFLQFQSQFGKKEFMI